MDDAEAIDRRALRRALTESYPWLTSPLAGPTTVDAGECDRCGTEPRLVTTCGPDGARLGRRCATAAGLDGWCEGHEDEADEALSWLAHLPDEADDVARLWWVATGEVRLDSLAALAPRMLPPAVVAVLDLD